MNSPDTPAPKPDTNSPAAARRFALLCFAVGLCTGLVVVFVGFRAQGLVANSRDPYGFEALGMQLARGEGFAGAGSVLGRRSPLYPLFIGLVYTLFGERPLVLQLIQALLFAGTCALACAMGRRWFGNRAGLLAGLLCAFHPSLLRYVADFHLETFFTFLFTLVLWQSLRFLEKPILSNALLFGVLCGLAALTKAVVAPYPLVFVAFWLWKQRNAKNDTGIKAKPWLPAAIVLLGMGLTIAPWTVRNYRVTGKFLPLGTGFSDAFLRGLIFSKTEYALLKLPPYTYAENECNAWFNALCAAKGTTVAADDVQTEAIQREEMKRQLRTNPLASVRRTFVGLFTFWYQMTSPLTSLVAGLTAAVAWVLALLGWRRSRQEGQTVWPLFLPILLLNLQLALLLAMGRYSVPILPALITLAAFGLDTLLPEKIAGIKH